MRVSNENESPLHEWTGEIVRGSYLGGLIIDHVTRRPRPFDRNDIDDVAAADRIAVFDMAFPGFREIPRASRRVACLRVFKKKKNIPICT